MILFLNNSLLLIGLIVTFTITATDANGQPCEQGNIPCQQTEIQHSLLKLSKSVLRILKIKQQDQVAKCGYDSCLLRYKISSKGQRQLAMNRFFDWHDSLSATPRDLIYSLNFSVEQEDPDFLTVVCEFERSPQLAAQLKMVKLSDGSLARIVINKILLPISHSSKPSFTTSIEGIEDQLTGLARKHKIIKEQIASRVSCESSGHCLLT